MFRSGPAMVAPLGWDAVVRRPGLSLCLRLKFTLTLEFPGLSLTTVVFQSLTALFKAQQVRA